MAKFTFLCNTHKKDIPKIERLKLPLSFGEPQATPGYSREENKKANLRSVWRSR